MLDLKTIFIFSTAMNLFVIVATTIVWLHTPSRKDTRFWSIAAWLAVSGPAILSAGDILPFHAAEYLGGLLYVASAGFMRLGFKAFYDHPARPFEAFRVAVASVFVLMLNAFLTDDSVTNIALIYVIIAANLALVAKTVWHGKPGEKLPSRYIATAIIAASAVGNLVVAPFSYFDPIAFYAGMPVASWLAFSTILLVLFNLATYVMMMVLTLERSIERQRELAEMDALTRTMNRRAFYNRIGKLSDTSGVLAIIDLDHFKLVNDTYGHQAGDEVLRSLAHVAKECLPKGVLFGRLGGEEFGVCLPGYGADAAHAVLDNLRAEFGRLEFRSVSNPPFRVTLSCGYSSFEAGRWTVDTTLAEADRALYVAKNSTRNLVLAFTPSCLLKPQSSRQEFRPEAAPVRQAERA